MESKETQAMTDEYCWFKALKRAIARNRRDAHNRYLQLATVRSDGSPAVRTLVFRSLQQDPPQLVMVTDSRSEKPAEIADQPAGEICWYLTRTREQFRLRGRLTLTGEESPDQVQRSEIWTAMSDAAREQFYWPHPRHALDASNTNRNTVLFETHAPPENFLIVTLHVESVDHLCLRGAPQTRWLSRCDGTGVWTSKAVNP